MYRDKQRSSVPQKSGDPPQFGGQGVKQRSAPVHGKVARRPLGRDSPAPSDGEADCRTTRCRRTRRPSPRRECDTGGDTPIGREKMATAFLEGPAPGTGSRFTLLGELPCPAGHAALADA
jgi:hypothetical protein